MSSKKVDLVAEGRAPMITMMIIIVIVIVAITTTES